MRSRTPPPRPALVAVGSPGTTSSDLPVVSSKVHHLHPVISTEGCLAGCPSVQVGTDRKPYPLGLERPALRLQTRYMHLRRSVGSRTHQWGRIQFKLPATVRCPTGWYRRVPALGRWHRLQRWDGYHIPIDRIGGTHIHCGQGNRAATCEKGAYPASIRCMTSCPKTRARTSEGEPATRWEPG